MKAIRKKRSINRNDRRALLMLASTIALILLLLVPCPDALIFVLAAFSIVVGLTNFAALLISRTTRNPIEADGMVKLKKVTSWNTQGIRTILFAVGFCGALLISFLGLNWKNCTGSLALEILEPPTFAEVDDDTEIVLTFRKEKKLPPPPKPVSNEIIVTKEVVEVEELPDKVEIKEVFVTDIVIPVEPPEDIPELQVFSVVEQMPSFGTEPKDLPIYLSKSCYAALGHFSDIGC